MLLLPLFFISSFFLAFITISNAIEIPYYIFASMIVFWGIALYADISFTVKNKHLIRYEQTSILSVFLKKFSLKNATTLTLVSECTIVIISSIIILHKWDFEFTALTCLFVGIIHTSGFYSNKKFVTHNM